MARTNTAYPSNWQNPGSQGRAGQNWRNGYSLEKGASWTDPGPFFDAKTGQTFENKNLLGYLPWIFSKETQLVFWETSLLPRIVNVKYEAELKKQGEKVFIPKRPFVTVKEIKQGVKIEPDVLKADEPIEFTVDHDVGWAFKTYDLTTQMTHIKDYAQQAQETAIHAMQDYMEPLVLKTMVESVDSANQGATAGVRTKSYNLGTPDAPIALKTGDASATNVLADLYGVLREQNVFSKGARPFCVVQPRFQNMLAKSSLSAFNISGENNPLIRRGQESIGTVQGLDLFSTNYLEADSEKTNVFPVLVGTTDATTFAMTLQQMERFRSPDEYADITRAHTVFGYKVILPIALAVAWVTYGS